MLTFTKPHRRHRLTILLILLGFLFVFVFLPARVLIKDLSRTQALARETADAAKTQDLPRTSQKIGETKKQIEKTRSTYRFFFYLRVIPLLGGYYSDGEHMLKAGGYLLDAGEDIARGLEPYADILGLRGKGTFSGGSADERIRTAVETLDKIIPSLGTINEDLTLARSEIDKISTWKYPNIFGFRPRAKIIKAKETIDQVETFFVDAKPLIEVLPDILGAREPKEYLLLFQNDKELRPTGGFITAYAIFNVDKGKMTSKISEDIYVLDGTKRKILPAPEPLARYLKVSQWHLRDTNISPDFVVSMKNFESIYKDSGGYHKVDGIIALDTKFLVDLMHILGPIPVYGTTFTTQEVEACACPQVIYELEKFADEPKAYERGSRKDIIGVLMNAILHQALSSSPSQSWPRLINQVLSSAKEKDLLFYMYDQKVADATDKLNFTGRIKDSSGDYLHINEANLGGAKSNLYVEKEVKQQVELDRDGTLKKILTINYKYPRRADNCSLERKEGLCLAGIYQAWLRIYVPKGSELVKFDGSSAQTSVYEDLGKTVFEGFVTVRPQGSAQIKVSYKVPLKVRKGEEYKVLIQKQPGTNNFRYETEVKGKKKESFDLRTDQEVVIKT